jgi:hypothetical protein
MPCTPYCARRYESDRALLGRLRKAGTAAALQALALLLKSSGQLAALTRRVQAQRGSPEVEDAGSPFTGLLPSGSGSGDTASPAAAVKHEEGQQGEVAAGHGAAGQPRWTRAAAISTKRVRTAARASPQPGLAPGAAAAPAPAVPPPATPAAAVPLAHIAQPIPAAAGSQPAAPGIPGQPAPSSQLQLVQQLAATASQPGAAAAGITPQLVGRFLVARQERQAATLRLLLAHPTTWPAAAAVMEAASGEEARQE